MLLENSFTLSQPHLFDDVFSAGENSFSDHTPRLFSTKVYVRICPFYTRNFLKENDADMPRATVKLGAKEGIITLLDPSKQYAPCVVYGFDRCFDSGAAGNDQVEVYQHVGYNVLQSVIDGYNGCVFAYGQTGSGKTYTILGENTSTFGGHYKSGTYVEPFLLTPRGANKKLDEFTGLSASNVYTNAMENIFVADSIAEKPLIQIRETDGILPRIAADIFNSLLVKHSETAAHTFRIEVEFYEIYNEKIFDLLCERNSNVTELRLRHQATCGAYVEGLARKHVTNEKEMLYWILRGSTERHTTCTKLNDCSSRSHAIFTIHVEQISLKENGISSRVSSKLNLVDLAGSERAGMSGAEGKHFKEATKINLSLTVLGRVIDCLADLSQSKSLSVPVPYRDSNLTWLLMDSLGGNSKTSMVATISPSVTYYEQTCQTLRYASRAKQIVNKAVINEDPQVRQIKELAAEVKRLKSLLYERIHSFKDNVNTDKLKEQILKLELDIANRDCTIDSLRFQLADKSVTELRQLSVENQQLRREVKNVKQIRATNALLEKKLKAADEETKKLSARLLELEKKQSKTLTVSIVNNNEMTKEGESGGDSREGTKSNSVELRLRDETVQRLKKLGINTANNTLSSIFDTLTLAALDNNKKKKERNEIHQKDNLLSQSFSCTPRRVSEEESALLSARKISSNAYQKNLTPVAKSRFKAQVEQSAAKEGQSAKKSPNRENQLLLCEEKIREKEKELGALSVCLSAANERVREEVALVKTLKDEKKHLQKQLESSLKGIDSLKKEARSLRVVKEYLKKSIADAEERLSSSKKETNFLLQQNNNFLQAVCAFTMNFIENRNRIFALEANERQGLVISNSKLILEHRQDIMAKMINDIKADRTAIVEQAEATSSLLLGEIKSLRQLIELREKQQMDCMTSFTSICNFCSDVLLESPYKKSQIVEQAFSLHYSGLCKQQGALLEQIAYVKREVETKEKHMHFLLESETAQHTKILHQKQEELMLINALSEKTIKSLQDIYLMEMNQMFYKLDKYLDTALRQTDDMLELHKNNATIMINEFQKEYNSRVCCLTRDFENSKVLLAQALAELGEASKKIGLQKCTIEEQEMIIDGLSKDLEQTQHKFNEKEQHLRLCSDEEKKKLHDLVAKKDNEKNVVLQDLSKLENLLTNAESYTTTQNSLYTQYIDDFFTIISDALEKSQTITALELQRSHEEEFHRMQNTHALKVGKLERAVNVAKSIISQLLSEARNETLALHQAHNEQLLYFASRCLAISGEFVASRQAVAQEEEAERAALVTAHCCLATRSERSAAAGRQLVADHVVFADCCAAEHAAFVEDLSELLANVSNATERVLQKSRKVGQATECMRLESVARGGLILCEEGERNLFTKFFEILSLLAEKRIADSREIFITTRALLADSDSVLEAADVSFQCVPSISLYVAESLLLERYKQCLLEELFFHLMSLSEIFRTHSIDGVVMELGHEHELKLKVMEADFQREILLLQKEEAERRSYVEKVREFSDFEANLDYLEKSILQKAQQEDSSKQGNQLHLVRHGIKRDSLLSYSNQQKTKISNYLSSFFSSSFSS